MCHLPPSLRSPKGFALPALLLTLAAVVVAMAGIGSAFYFTKNSTVKTAETPSPVIDAAPVQPKNTANWQQGDPTPAPAAPAAPEKNDFSWWVKTFNLPQPADSAKFLVDQGLTVQGIDPLHYGETQGIVTITYHVQATVPGQLFRLQTVAWNPEDPTLARFAPLIVLNQDVNPGHFWDTQHPIVVAQAGQKLDFTWMVHVNVSNHEVTSDRPPLVGDAVTQQQIAAYDTEAGNIVAALQAQIQQVQTRAQNKTKSRLASIPADPPKPKPLTSQFGGDGSGEPTKSAARIGGGAAGGAAGGAIFGSIAGNAGLGSGIGAGVGLLGGAIYDAVSKDNDKKQQERAVAAENVERLDNWKIEIKSLRQQREQAKASLKTETDRGLNNLATSLKAHGGFLPPQ